MEFLKYPRLSELKDICRLIFSTSEVHIRSTFSLNEAFLEVQERRGKKESIHPYLPPVVITEAEKGMFKASLRSEQFFGISVRLQNSPGVQGQLKDVPEGAEITVRLNYTSTFRLRVLALTLVVLAMMTMALILLINVILGSYDVLIIALVSILISFFLYRSILSEVWDCSEVDGALIKWVYSVFPGCELDEV